MIKEDDEEKEEMWPLPQSIYFLSEAVALHFGNTTVHDKGSVKRCMLLVLGATWVAKALLPPPTTSNSPFPFADDLFQGILNSSVEEKRGRRTSSHAAYRVVARLRSASRGNIHPEPCVVQFSAEDRRSVCRSPSSSVGY